MTSENILVSIVAIIASFAALVVVALAIDYPKRIWHHLTGGTYKPVEQVASAYLLPTGVAAAGGMILVLGIVALVQPFDLYDVSRAEATVVTQYLTATPTPEFEVHHAGESEESGGMSRNEGIERLRSRGCLVCHAFGDEGSKIGPGPQLEGLSVRTQIAGTIELTGENLKRWLANPPSMKPGTAMPNFSLSPSEIDEFSEFLMHH